MYCAIVVVLVLSGVSLVPASAMMNDPAPDSLDQSPDFTGLNEYGMSIKKLPDASAGGTAVSSTTGQNPNPVVNAAVHKLETEGMKITRTQTARYEISITDASLAQIKSESEALSANADPALIENIQSEHSDEIAQLKQMQDSTQQYARHEDGKTISPVEISTVTYTNQKTGESRNAVVMQSMDARGNPTGTTQIISDSGDYQDAPGTLSAQSVNNPELKKLQKHYSLTCGWLKAGFWFLMAFIVDAAIAALICIVLLVLYLIPLIVSATGFAAGYVTVGSFLAALLLKLALFGETFLLVIPVIATGALIGGSFGMPLMFLTLKDACTQSEEYKGTSIPTVMRPDWGLLDNHRTIVWQNNDGSSYTGIHQAADGGYFASGFGTSCKVTKGVVAKFDATGKWLNTMEIGKDKFTVINDIRVSPDGAVYAFGATESTAGSGIGTRTGSNADGVVLKLDPNGMFLWSRSIGDNPKNTYGFASGAIGSDGTIYAAGVQVISESPAAGFLAALNPDGTDHAVPAWGNKPVTTFKFTGNSDMNKFTRIQPTQDNGLIIVGSTLPANQKEPKGWLLKLNADMNQEWSVSGGSDSTTFTGVQQTPTGNYLVAGSTGKSPGDGGLFLKDDEKLGSAGFVTTRSTSGIPTGTVNFANLMETVILDIQPAADGGYIVSGLGRINGGPIAGVHGKKDAWVAKLRPDLSIEWQKTLGGTNDDGFVSAIEASNGDVVAVGLTKSSDYDLSERGKKADGVTAGWIVDLRYDPNKAPDRMDTYLTQ